MGKKKTKAMVVTKKDKIKDLKKVIKTKQTTLDIKPVVEDLTRVESIDSGRCVICEGLTNKKIGGLYVCSPSCEEMVKAKIKRQASENK